MKKVLLIMFIVNMCLSCFGAIINIPEDYTSIQAGINATAPGDTVLVQPGIYCENLLIDDHEITLASLYLTTADSSYIDQTVIDGNGMDSVVRMNNIEGEAEICGFNITNGISYAGGGVYIENCNPKLDHLNISYNSAYKGGGIYSENSSLNIENVNIRYNDAESDGAGLYCETTIIDISKLVLSDNNANFDGALFLEESNGVINNFLFENNCVGESGGGINIVSSNLELIDGICRNNSATNGGGFSSHFSDLAMTNINISSNSAYNSGGIFSYHSQINLNSTNIVGNIAENYGGGLYIGGQSEINFSEEDRCNIYSNYINSVRGVGSDIYSSNGLSYDVIVDTFTVLNPSDYHASPIIYFTFDINYSIGEDTVEADIFVAVDGDDLNSGINENDPLKTIQKALQIINSNAENIYTIHLADGIYSPSTNGEIFPICLNNFIILQGESIENTILDAENSARVINAEYVQNTQIKRLSVTNGNDDYGGGIYCSASDIVLEDLEFYNNSAEVGGAIYINSSLAGIRNVSIHDNQALNGGGMSIVGNDDVITLDNVSIYRNVAKFGAGIKNGSGNIKLIDCLISENEFGDVDGNGAGIYCYMFSMTEIIDSTIENNYIQNGEGAGIYTFWSSLVIDNSVIENNFCEEGVGAGIFSIGSTINIDRSKIISNTANGYNSKGGGLWLLAGETAIVRTSISDNSANSGAGIFIDESDIYLENNTFSNNMAITGGSISFFRNSSVSIKNCILRSSGTNELYNYYYETGNILSINYSNIQNGEQGIVMGDGNNLIEFASNIDLDPLFVDPENGDYHLSADSPCIDAGDPDSPLDPDGTTADLGAFYFDQSVGLEDSELEQLSYQISNYPNPFHPSSSGRSGSTTIAFSLSHRAAVDISIYNVKGQKVQTIAHDQFAAGKHSAIWNGVDKNNKQVSSGIYYYKLSVDGKDVAAQKCLLLK
ncbi:MAG: right-handed parallel beta-helix repeat-containing protein [Candidatus Cloacimonadales bacterium]